MLNHQMFNPQPNYSGVTIQIANPAVNVNPYGTNCSQNGFRLNNNGDSVVPLNPYYQGVRGENLNPALYSDQYLGNNSSAMLSNRYGMLPENIYSQNPGQDNMNNGGMGMPYNGVNNQNGQILIPSNNQNETINPYSTQYGQNGQLQPNTQNIKTNGTSSMQDLEYGKMYPAGYYINNYNIQSPNAKVPQQKIKNNSEIDNNTNDSLNNMADNSDLRNINPDVANLYKDYADSLEQPTLQDMTASNNIINDLNKRNAEIKEANKNTKEQKVLALTDEYIKSLENYLDNPNDELRLMASKEVLTRLDEDKNRYDDAALNALLNKMLQDPSKLVRLAALSAFASQLASGNDYTVQLLQNIQSDPNGDKEDALQAADILLKMSAGVEVKNVPVTEEEKRKVYKMKQRVSG